MKHRLKTITGYKISNRIVSTEQNQGCIFQFQFTSGNISLRQSGMNQYIFIGQLQPSMFGLCYSKYISAELKRIVIEMSHCQIFDYTLLKQMWILSFKNSQHQFGLVGYVNIGISVSIPISVFITIYILTARNVKINNRFPFNFDYLWRKIWTG